MTPNVRINRLNHHLQERSTELEKVETAIKIIQELASWQWSTMVSSVTLAETEKMLNKLRYREDELIGLTEFLRIEIREEQTRSQIQLDLELQAAETENSRVVPRKPE